MKKERESSFKLAIALKSEISSICFPPPISDERERNQLSQ
jgi:hypothetical protein